MSEVISQVPATSFFDEVNPLIVADEINLRVSEWLRDQSISLYSAFLLNQDELRLRRDGYRQPGWRHELSLSGVLRLYMQYLFSVAVDEPGVASTLAGWLRKDAPLLAEHREHYLLKHLARLADSPPATEVLSEFSSIRARYETLPDDDGPFHNEVFPYDYCSPEDILLGRSNYTIKKGTIEPKAEKLMLAVATWGAQ